MWLGLLTVDIYRGRNTTTTWRYIVLPYDALSSSAEFRMTARDFYANSTHNISL